MHKHKWEVHSPNAVGVFEKQEGQIGSEVKTLGTVFKCRDPQCGKMILEPENLRLRRVEVFGPEV